MCQESTNDTLFCRPGNPRNISKTMLYLNLEGR